MFYKWYLYLFTYTAVQHYQFPCQMMSFNSNKCTRRVSNGEYELLSLSSSLRFSGVRVSNGGYELLSLSSPPSFEWSSCVKWRVRTALSEFTPFVWVEFVCQMESKNCSLWVHPSVLVEFVCQMEGTNCSLWVHPSVLVEFVCQMEGTNCSLWVHPLRLSGVHVDQSLVFCVMFCRSLFVLLSVFLVFLRFTTSDYPPW
jgi:hypothetical protein